MTVRLSMVVAVARNGVIGADGGLAWKISGDLKWFKSVTTGKPILMGRKTFDSIGRALPGRDNIVVTRSLDFAAEGVFVARTLDGALTLAEELAEARGVEECCIIGGAEIYAQLLDRTQRIYLTRVDADVNGDAFFPDLDSGEWSETKVSKAEKNAKNQFACDFFILDRKARICAKEA
ncbi:dihydrofolate reductase [Hyphococcus sp.]|uniref:dihydrofolate reductase n=1 Tax=Hyphococcus sp. TaxID=2038636 RepID=UPI0020879460|nr:MAG: dihydrofolate reductase [Marinicaulis sp.]